MDFEEVNYLSKGLKLFTSWGWVFGFVFLCLFTYSYAAKKKTQIYQNLHERVNTLTVLKERAILEQEELKLQINSQSDPLFVQQILMKGLGLVPEGHKKIHFYDDSLR